MDKYFGVVGLAVRAGKVRFGTHLTLKALASGEARAVAAATDLGGNNKKKIEHGCAEAKVPLVFRGTAEELGRAAGKDKAGVLCVCDENLANAVIKAANSGKDGSPNE